MGTSTVSTLIDRIRGLEVQPGLWGDKEAAEYTSTLTALEAMLGSDEAHRRINYDPTDTDSDGGHDE